MSQQTALARPLVPRARRKTRNGSQIVAQQGHRQYTRSRNLMLISIVCWQPKGEDLSSWSSSKCSHKVKLAGAMVVFASEYFCEQLQYDTLKVEFCFGH